MDYKKPVVTKILESDDKLSFTISSVDTSIVNGIRRTILADIPVICIRTESYAVNDCIITKNTSNKHNEYIMQRISSCPVNDNNDKSFCDKYEVVCDVKNDTESEIILVTTGDFKIRHKKQNMVNGDNNYQYLSEEETKKIFVPNELTGDYIEIVTLNPGIGSTIPGEHFAFTATFSLCTGRTNGMYVVGDATFGNTIDMTKADQIWDVLEKKYQSENVEQKSIVVLKRDFYILNAQQYYIPQSFDFVVSTFGTMTNMVIIKKACSILCDKLEKFIIDIGSNNIPIFPCTETKTHGYKSVIELNMENGYDIILENEDATLGLIINNAIHTLYFNKHTDTTDNVTFCAYRKFHPHDHYSVLRIGLQLDDKTHLYNILKKSCEQAKYVLTDIKNMFLQ